jgi:hypothetical protein
MMHHRAERICVISLTSLLLLFLTLTTALEAAAYDQPIGSITALEGEVYLYHKGEKGDTLQEVRAMLGDAIYLYDHILTEKLSRVQILFDDESLLNLAEETYIQITEHVYSPEKNRRSSIFRLMVGKVRAIVGRYFAGAGSGFVVNTPTAIIGVRGTHFVVDATRTDETTVICIDTGLDLAVRNAMEEVSGEVILTGGMMTRVLEGQAPTPPSPAPDDLMMRLLNDTRVMLPSLHGGPGEMKGLLQKGVIVRTRGVLERGTMPPVPEAPDQPLFQPIAPTLPPPPLPPPTP